MMTSVAMMLSSTIIRIFLGMTVRSREMIRFENARTKVRDNPMTNAVFSCTVTARALQIPSICIKIGLFLRKGVENVLNCCVWVTFIFYSLAGHVFSLPDKCNNCLDLNFKDTGS